MDKIDIEKTYNHWIETSDKDFGTMVHLFESKDFHWSLFIGDALKIAEKYINSISSKYNIQNATA